MRSSANGMFLKNNSVGEARGSNMNPEELEIRPGGMLVQKRDSGSDQNSVSVPTIKVRVKHGSKYHEIYISSQASFGELKKMLAERTGLHHEDQKIIYKNKERYSKEYLDTVRVKDGSKMVLVEDSASRERRCLEMMKNANAEKVSKSLSQISQEVDEFSKQVTAMEATVSTGKKFAEADVDNIIGSLMTELVKLDELVVNGELKLQKQMLEKRVQKYIETLDIFKLQNTMPRSKEMEKIPLKQQEVSVGQRLKLVQRQQVLQEKQRKNSTGQIPVLQQQPLRQQSESVIVTTKWETFD
ncbi:hypothetical protein SLEP1_g8705 [Rubroshorea leprosula]|uniref:Ubiquitin-like domain-containing protein n=1 Tax=Rubroshorea leprosula TaxID=152421 RepID=A0AAV5IDN7_9ROSI|nr:hypothetical protein SLEP1_g8705 [Rubroshorea leprosula]